MRQVGKAGNTGNWCKCPYAGITDIEEHEEK